MAVPCRYGRIDSMQTAETRERALVRRKQGRIIAGVAGGLADYTETPAKWWRWAFAGVAVLGWPGFLVLAPPVVEIAHQHETWGRLGFLVVLLAAGLAECTYLALWIL